jgi:hypothetical protein
MLQRIRYLLVIALTAAVVIFAMQNLHPVQVTFLLWGFQAPVTLVTFVPFIAGLIVGAVAALWWRRGRPSARPPQPEVPDRLKDTGPTWGGL